MRRRELLAAAAVAALARPATAAAADGEADLLIDLVALDAGAARAYREAGRQFDEFAANEAAHAGALRTNIEALGRRVPALPAELDGAAARLAAATGGSRMTAAIALEDELISAYERALLDIETPGIVQTAATILASHAQHRALLLRAAGRDPFG